MRKVHLEAPSFPDFRLSADSLTFANSRRFKFQTCLRLWLPIAVILLAHLCVADVRAQGSIIVIEKNRRSVKPPTDEVTRIAGATRRAEPIRILPMDLKEGDELIGNGETVSVRVRCKNSAEYALAGKFRVRFLPTTTRACFVSFEGKAGATMIVDATIPTSVQIGETKLASRRTAYQVILAHDSGLPGANAVSGAEPEIRVYEGNVDVLSPLYKGVVEEGQRLAAGTARPVKLELKHFLDAADILTKLDIAQMIFLKWQCEACASLGEIDPAYQKLLNLRQSLLQDPNNQTKSTALEEALNEYRISDQIVLKPGEKRIVPVGFVSGCRNPIKVQATLSNLSFSRLVSAAVAVVPTGISNWQIELGATGLPPGVYTAEIVFECLDCLKQKCAVTKSVVRLGFFVK